MKTRYEMTKLFSVERDFDGNIKVIAGNTTKTYKDLPISTVSFLFGLSEYVARSAELFEKYVEPEQESTFSENMLSLADSVEKAPNHVVPIVHKMEIGGHGEVASALVSVVISSIEYAFAHAMRNADKTFDTIIHDIAVKKLIDVIK